MEMDFFQIINEETKNNTSKRTHTHPFYGPLDFVRDYPSEPVPEPIWILLKQDSEWQWHQLGRMQICTLSRQITMPTPHHSVFTGWMPFLPPNQQRQSTEGKHQNIQ